MVNGSPRCPYWVRQQPLQSVVQTAVGWVAGVQVVRSGWLTGRRRRRFRVCQAVLLEQPTDGADSGHGRAAARLSQQ
jgi:hypothetical protein